MKTGAAALNRAAGDRGVALLNAFSRFNGVIAEMEYRRLLKAK
jgi:hypothetical protein